MNVVMATYFVGRVMQSLLTNDIIMYAAIGKRVVLIVVDAGYKYP